MIAGRVEIHFAGRVQAVIVKFSDNIGSPLLVCFIGCQVKVNMRVIAIGTGIAALLVRDEEFAVIVILKGVIGLVAELVGKQGDRISRILVNFSSNYFYE